MNFLLSLCLADSLLLGEIAKIQDSTRTELQTTIISMVHTEKDTAEYWILAGRANGLHYVLTMFNEIGTKNDR